MPVPSVHNSDNDETYRNPIRITRAGVTLVLKESESPDFNGWSCRRAPERDLTLFPVRTKQQKK